MIQQNSEIIHVGDKVSFEAESEILTGYCYAIEAQTITFLAYGKLYPVGRALAERDTVLLEKLAIPIFLWKT